MKLTISIIVLLSAWLTSSEEVKPPHGHLLPLGHQTPPTVDIDEISADALPSPEVFFQDYIKQGKAAIFRGAMLNTKAFKLWTDGYIKQNYGNLEVRLEEKVETAHRTPIGEKYLGRDTLGHFVDNYKSPESSTYIVSELPKPMYKDVGVLPSLGACGELKNTFVEIDLWWSGGGSRSIIHKDTYNQVNCLYRGTKYWKLFEYKYEKWLYEHSDTEIKGLSGFSAVKVNAVDLIKFPDFAKIPWSNISIHAGDCLFLPKDYYHQVDSDGPNNLAVSILFSRLDNRTSIDTSDCNDGTDYRAPRPLSDFEVMWEWEGQGVMSMGNGDLYEVFKAKLESFAEDMEEEGDALTAEVLQEEVNDNADKDIVSLSSMEKAISLIDKNGDNKVSLSEVKSMNISQLREFGKLVEPYEPSNTYEYEYSYVCFWTVRESLQEMIKVHKAFSRQQWIETYIDECKGTEKFADEIFTELTHSRSSNIVVSENVSNDDIQRALKNWVEFWAPQYCKRNPNENSDITNDDEVEDEATNYPVEDDDVADLLSHAALKDEL